MKKIILLLIILTICISAYGKNMKAVYVSTWNPGLLSKAQVDATIKAAESIGVTDLFIQVRRMNDAYYPSKIVPHATNMKENFDMLDYVIKKAKSKNMKVHAWFVICRIGMQDYKKALTETQISWLDCDKNGKLFNENNVFIDPSNPMAKAYIISVINEVVKNYNIDGVHLDYIRYPNSSFGYSRGSMQRFTLETGYLIPDKIIFDNFRREQITKFIYEIRQSINKTKKVTLSASVVSWGSPTTYKNLTSYVNTFQDYEKWIKNDYVDYVMPMVYKREHIAQQSKDFGRWLDVYSNHTDKIVPAIGGYLNNAQGIKKQIALCENKGFSNWIIFDFNEGTDRQNLINALK